MHAEKDAAGALRPQLIAWVIALVLAVIAFSQNQTARDSLAEITRFEIADGSDDVGRVNWRPVEEGDLKPRKGITGYRVFFEINDELLAPGNPLALQLSGLFSSSVVWNGVPIGENGEPAKTRQDEKPGRIDAVFFIPPEALRPGANSAVISVSSNRNTLPADSILHRIAVKNYDADARRSVREYMAPIIALGIFAVAAVGFMTLRAQGSLSGTGTLAALIVAAAATAAMAETARAFLNYPYPFHALRIGVLALSVCAFTAALAAYASSHLAIRRKTLLIAGVIVFSFLVMALPLGWNTRLYAILLFGGLLTIVLSASAISNKQSVAKNMLMAAAPLLLCSVVGAGLYLDTFFYIALIPFFAGLYHIERVTALAASQSRSPTPAPKTITFKERGSVSIVPLKDICAVKAAGNYAELLLRDGKQQLVSESLSVLKKRLPANFVRAHRSYLVNLNDIEGLNAVGPGKFEAVLNAETIIPVSRTHIKALRSAVENNHTDLSTYNATVKAMAS